MNLLRFTLVTDGSSDVVLMPILEWLLLQVGVSFPIKGSWADLRGFRRNKPKTLEQKIERAVNIFPCEILFIHRDAERLPRNRRACEISRSATRALKDHPSPPFICVVPVRMQEAWLLFNEPAIRKAAGNPNGKRELNLPPLKRLESHPDPKGELYQFLKRASGLNRRRLKKFDVKSKVHLVPINIKDYSPLMKLAAFKALRKDLAYIVADQGWSN